ncbi:hypothetical protein I4U23_007656 [Adineta vaga]|nr:hypothetical protein I4U23_007656 [Adineta vaga]
MNIVSPEKRYQPTCDLSPDQIINQLNICYRVCYKYTPNKSNKDEQDLCQCNHPKMKHKDETSSSNKTKWSMENNTKRKPNSKHGPVVNDGKYVQLALDTPVEIVERILLEAWKIPKPSFIVSIIGGVEYFKLHDRLETNFINGIIDIARKSNAWLITTGYRVGIAQLVGEAISKVKYMYLENKQITAIGLSKWGCISNQDQVLRSKADDLQEKIEAYISKPTSRKKPKTERLSGQYDLEMNHSHYLMLDDGTIRSDDTGDYRTRLAVHLGRLQRKNDVFIPVVTLVVEGGKDTITNIYYDLKSNIPVVIVDGSGRANFLHQWLLNTKELDNDAENRTKIYEINELEVKYEENHSNHDSNAESSIRNSQVIHLSGCEKLLQIFKNYRERLKNDLKNVLISTKGSSSRDNEEFETLVKQVMYCLQPAVRSDITIFDFNSDGNLSEAIFRSVCRSRQKLSKTKRIESGDLFSHRQHHKSHDSIYQKEQNAERSQLLDVAMDWNCIDAAKEWIFRGALDNILDKHQAFINALQKNLPSFVYEFLNLGIDPSETFFEKKTLSQDNQYRKFLRTLYTSREVNSEKRHLKYFIDEDSAVKGRKIESVEKLNMILSTLIDHKMHNLYFNTLNEEAQYRERWGLSKIPNNKYPNENGDSERKNLFKEENKIDHKERIRDYIMRDLFLWAILMNHIELAKVFLAHMKYRICPALIATKILKQYYLKATYGDLKTSYETSAHYFEQYAINCLDKCDKYDRVKACEIVLQQNEVYGYVTCLQIAATADDKDFIATPCCVQALDNIWYDKLYPEQMKNSNIIWLILGFVTCGLVAPKPKGFDQTCRKLKSNGLNYCEPFLLEYPHESVPKPAHRRYLPKLAKFHESLPVKYSYHLISYNLIFFICIIAIVMAGYGVASRSMTYYPIVNNFTQETGGPIDARFDGRSIFRNIAYPVYYLLYGEFGNELSSLDDHSDAGCKRFDEVYEDTKKIWHYQQYCFVRDYFHFSENKSGDRRMKVFKMIAKEKALIKQWQQFEESSTFEYAHDEVKIAKSDSNGPSKGSDTFNKENTKDIMIKDNTTNETLHNLQQTQDDLIELHCIMEEVAKQCLSTEHSSKPELYYRVCTQFSPNSENKDVCVCNQPEQFHTERENEWKKWSMQTHTKKKRFDHSGRFLNIDASFVRIAPDTKMNEIEKLLLKTWKIARPKLIISIIGSTKYSDLTDRLESDLINGIVDIATKPDVWMITNGYNMDIVRLVGQAIKKNKLKQSKQEMIAIGICKWGCIKNVEYLTDFKEEEEEETQKQIRRHRLSNFDKDEGEKYCKGGQYELEMNHSHYLMLDDGRYGYTDTEDFRTQLCCRMVNLDDNDKSYVPVVTLVVGGDLNTIENIYYDLSNNIPVIITIGSGRISQFFTRWLKYTKRFDDLSEERKILYEISELKESKMKSSHLRAHNVIIDRDRTIVYTNLYLDRSVTKLDELFKDYKKHLQDDLRYTLYGEDDSDTRNDTCENRLFSKAVQQVLFCLQPSVRHNITIFSINSEYNFSETLFRSICTSYETFTTIKEKRLEEITSLRQIADRENQNDGKLKLLELAMDWNCIEVAKEFVLQNSLHNISNQEETFIKALTNNLPYFIYEFIKLGIDPGEIFFPGDTFSRSSERYDKFIKVLYNKQITKNAESRLQSFIDDNGKLANKAIDSTDALNVILRVLIGDYMHELYFDGYQGEYLKRIESGLKKPIKPKIDDESITFPFPSNEMAKELAQDYIMRDLFLWTILMNYIEMAKVFLSHMKYRVCPALIATKILKQYYHYETHEDIRIIYKNNANYFEKYAINCLRECVEHNAERTCKIILQQNELYGYVTCLQVAADAEDKLFIASPCSVQAMNNIWYDQLYPEQTRKRDIIALSVGFATFGLTAPASVSYREIAGGRDGESLKQILRSNGITYCDSYPLQHPPISDSASALNRYLHRWKNFHLSLMMKFYLIFFICIIAIVMAGYGVASRSMTYYPIVNNFTQETGGSIDARFDGRSIFRNIAYPVYYLLYGEFGNELSSLDDHSDAGWSIATHVLLAIHMIFVNILLTNLLIAMFSKRFDEVYEDTKNIWHSQQYLFTRDYFLRSPFFPPINLVQDLFSLLKMVCIFLIKLKIDREPSKLKRKVFKIIPKHEPLMRKWRDFEAASTYKYAHDEVKASKVSAAKLYNGLDSNEVKTGEDIINKDDNSNHMANSLDFDSHLSIFNFTNGIVAQST